MKPSVVIRLALHGCTNRPFYHLVVNNRTSGRDDAPIEQIGSFDPLPNKHNEKLVGVNFERLRYWIGKGAVPTQSVEELLGLSGFFPIHPMTYIVAKRNQKAIELENLKQSELSNSVSDSSPESGSSS